MSSLRLDHIPILEGTSNFPEWRRAMERTLMGEGVWGHAEGEEGDPLSPWRPSYPPVISATTTPDELKVVQTWWQSDAKTKDIIEHRISPLIVNLLPQGRMSSARLTWSTINDLYGRVDVTAQFALRSRIAALRLKDSLDAENYLGEFNVARSRFSAMGVAYSELECVHQIISGLPLSVSWDTFKQLLLATVQTMSDEAYRLRISAPDVKPLPDLIYNTITQRIITECIRQDALKPSQGPGSEYANAALGKEIRKHANNPNGVHCTICTGRLGTGHDFDHCWAPGGGGTRPANFKSKYKAAEPTPKPESASVAVSDIADLFQDLSCASLEQLPAEASSPSLSDIVCIVQQSFSTLIDSGATSHLIRDESYFWSYDRAQASDVKTANHGILRTHARGDCVALLRHEGKTTRLKLRDCLHAPDAIINLLSVGRLVSSNFGCNFVDSCAVLSCPPSSGGPRVICGEALMNGRLFFVDLEFLPRPSASPPAPSAGLDMACFAKVPMSLDLLHARMGHLGGAATKLLPNAVEGITFDSTAQLSQCEPCIIAKHARIPHPATESRSTFLLELVHSDLCGPFPVQTPHGKNYFVVFLEDFSNVVDIQLLATKDQALEAWRIVQKRWENKLDAKVKIFRSDNGGEFIGADFSAALAADGIERQLSAPYAHQQNGKAERIIRTIEGHMFAMLTTAQASLSLWGEATLAAGYLLNVSVTSTLPLNTTPFEVFNKGVKPNLSHLRVWGVRCFARVPAELQTKLGVKSRECLFMGYPPGQKGWRVRDVVSRHFFTSCDVIFDENIPYRALHDVSAPPPPPSPPPAPPPATDLNPPRAQPDVIDDSAPAALPSRRARLPPPPPREPSGRVRTVTSAGVKHQAELAAARVHLENLRAARLAQAAPVVVPEETDAGDDLMGANPLAAPPVQAPDDPGLNEHANFVCDEVVLLTIRNDTRRNPSTAGYDMSLPPASVEEAMLRPDWVLWERAMDAELGTMKAMGVYRSTELPPGRKAIGCRWIFEFKTNAEGVLVARARLVAQGFSQIPSVDFGKTFAPVCKSTSTRLVAVIACRYDWELDCFDATRVPFCGGS